jgi:hypothetical protein
VRTYKITAGETIYAVYETEVRAKNKKEAEKIASEISAYDYKSNDWSNSAGDFAIEEIEEVQE